MCRSMVDIHSATAEIRRGKKKVEERKKKKPQGKNIMSASAIRRAAAIINSYLLRFPGNLCYISDNACRHNGRSLTYVRVVTAL